MGSKEEEIKTQQIEKICNKIKCKLISWRLLARGSHNESYLIKTKNGAYILKVENNPGYVKKEYDTLNNLKLGLGPKILLFDGSKKIIKKPFLVEEFLVGKNPSRKAKNKFIIQMAKWYKKLHSIKSSKIPKDEKKRIHSLYSWFKENHNKFKKYKNAIDKKLYKEIDSHFKKALNICKLNTEMFRKINRFSLNHNDPSRDNIFINNGNIKLVDWEFSGFGIPERDILIFFRQYKLNDEQKKLFLKSYGHPIGEMKKLNILYLILLSTDIYYLMHRLILIKNKKISSRQQNTNKKSVNKRILEIFAMFKRTLKTIN